jgi:hypothetical protein
VTFDYAAQAAETARLWAEMAEGREMPPRGLVDLHFKGGPEADSTEFIGWLEDRGFDVEHFPAATFDDGDEPETVEAQTAEMTLSVEAIQAIERDCTEAALRYGYRPTGWGFMVP